MYVLEIQVNIDNGRKAHNTLALLSEKLNKHKGESVTIDFKRVTFIAANQMAVFSALFDSFCANENSRIVIQNLSEKLSNVMRKNGFGQMLGMEPKEDSFHTTIPHRRFFISEIDESEKYLLFHIFQRDDIPLMISEAKNAIIDNMLEIFNNVKEHTSTKNIYSCGQFFPQSAVLYFTVADIGETIKYNVDRYGESEMEMCNRIQWAMQEGNSTRKNGTPGGLGFSVLSKFVRLNRGQLPSVDKGTHGRRRANFCPCFVAFLPRTSSTRQSSASQGQKLTSFRLSDPDHRYSGHLQGGRLRRTGRTLIEDNAENDRNIMVQGVCPLVH